MPLPEHPDFADQCSDALLKAKKANPGGLLRADIAQVLRPLVEEHDAALLAAGAPLRHTGTKSEQAKLFSALCKSCGLSEDGMTRPMKKTVAVARATIIQVMPNATPDEILLRGATYRRKHPTWELTPSSLAKHWGSLVSAESLQGRLDEPKGWKEHVSTIFPEAECGSTGQFLAERFWPQIGRPYQERICRMMSFLPKPQ